MFATTFLTPICYLLGEMVTASMSFSFHSSCSTVSFRRVESNYETRIKNWKSCLDDTVGQCHNDRHFSTAVESVQFIVP